jgi:outer membrane lipoprotein
MTNKFLYLVLIALLSSCASTPDFDTTLVDNKLTPKSIIAEPEKNRGKVILWGGTILDTTNLKDTTRLEVLAYPLDTSHRPLLESVPLGRFIIMYDGYLEPANYAQGRLLTVLGKVSGSQSGKVGESTYTYVVIDSEKLHLWSLDNGSDRTSFQFGVGVGVGL